MKNLVLFAIILLSNSLLAVSDNDPFNIPDSVLVKSSEDTIVFNEKVVALPLWANGLPDSSIFWAEDEYVENRTVDRNEYGYNRAIHRVKTPGMVVIKANSDNSVLTPAIVIFPGGGFERIVIDKEGIDVARWYNKHGITCIIVKYRTFQSGSDSKYQAVYTDAQRALRIVRSNAAEWSIDPDKIGIMGFSAGGWLSHMLLLDYSQGSHLTYDAISQTPFYPNFCCLVYTGFPNDLDTGINSNTAPTFLTGCRDDHYVDALAYQRFSEELSRFSIPSQVKLFDSGGHGYGLGVRGGEVTSWPTIFLNWLVDINMVNNSTSIYDQSNDLSNFACSYKLFQNHPNPFNPKTIIQFQLPDNDVHVSLQVYNSNGQQVGTLIDRNLNRREHQVTFNANKFQSGVYIYKFQR
jgi:predicted esterase